MHISQIIRSQLRNLAISAKPQSHPINTEEPTKSFQNRGKTESGSTKSKKVNEQKSLTQSLLICGSAGGGGYPRLHTVTFEHHVAQFSTDGGWQLVTTWTCCFSDLIG